MSVFLQWQERLAMNVSDLLVQFNVKIGLLAAT